MIHLVLDDLCRPVGVGLCAGFQVGGLVLHLDGLIALAGAGAAEEREASFLGVVFI